MSIFLAISNDSPFTKLSNLVDMHYKEKDKNEVKESVMLLFKLATSPQPGHRLTAKMIMAGYTPTKQASETWNKITKGFGDVWNTVTAAPGQAYDAVKKVTYDDTGIGDTVKKTINDAASGALQDSVAKWWESTPEAQYGLYAGLGGAGLGLLRNLTRKRDKGRKFISDVGTGMLLGGLGGAGYGAISKLAPKEQPSNTISVGGKQIKVDAQGNPIQEPQAPATATTPESKPGLGSHIKRVGQAARDAIKTPAIDHNQKVLESITSMNKWIRQPENIKLMEADPELKQKILTWNHIAVTGTAPTGEPVDLGARLGAIGNFRNAINTLNPGPDGQAVTDAILGPADQVENYDAEGRAGLEATGATAAGAAATMAKRRLGDSVGNWGAEDRLLKDINQRLASGPLDAKTKALLNSDAGIYQTIAAKTQAMSKLDPSVTPMTPTQVQQVLQSDDPIDPHSPIRKALGSPQSIKTAPGDYRAASPEADKILENRQSISKLNEMYKQKEMVARTLSTEGLNKLADLDKLKAQLQAAHASGNTQQIAALQAHITKTQNDIALMQHKLMSEREELLQYKKQISDLENVNKQISRKPFSGKVPIETKTFANAGVRQVPGLGRIPGIGGGINRVSGVNLPRRGSRMMRDIILGQLGAHTPHLMGFNPVQSELYGLGRMAGLPVDGSTPPPTPIHRHNPNNNYGPVGP